MTRHSSPRRLAGKRRRMDSWVDRDARKIQAGEQKLSRGMRQSRDWPVSGEQSAGQSRAEPAEGTEEEAG